MYTSHGDDSWGNSVGDKPTHDKLGSTHRKI